MERIDLKVQVRKSTGKGGARKLRREGFIPGVVYGAGMDSVALAIDGVAFRSSIRGETSGNAIINLSLGGSGQEETKVVMIRDMQIEPVSHTILHVDFHEIDLQEAVEVSVPLELVGKPEGVKEGGILQQIERELEIRCMPLNIPEKIEVDVSNLAIGDSLHVSDITAAGEFEVLSAGDKTIAAVAAPAAEEEEVAEEAVEGEEAAAEEEEKAKEAEGD